MTFYLQIIQSATEKELQSNVAHFDVLCDCGFSRPSVLVKEQDKVDIVQALALHSVLLRSKAEIDQFCEGLESCGVLCAIRKNPNLARRFFCVEGRGKPTSGNCNTSILTFSFSPCFNFFVCYLLIAEQVLAIFKSIGYSERGSNMRKKEDTFSMFVDYLDECEKGVCLCEIMYLKRNQ